ncbi:sugar-transfer associated ATP-grasp domain-containing protein [Marinobacter sp. SS8-8]|uniref:sugar-transfer associated ATP-grasp domain-containing protein n=1 Tax=Marinobacter sp. SS8-8 TaxID=3050452 RepID=UPI0026DEB9A5|nr:sugar-transfer associated ATP-grasp domain-containing protein [Marinobacter sp. SS8-8]
MNCDKEPGSPRLKIDELNGRNKVEKIYIYIIISFGCFIDGLVPYLRQVIRFLFLPYAYAFLIDWQVCKKSKTGVWKDFLYIFFVFKTFPDHYQQCRLWEKKPREWALYWGSNYNPFQRRSLYRVLQPPRYRVVYEDKRLCHDICILNGIPTPKEYKIIAPGENIESVLRQLMETSNTLSKRIVVKPVDGKGGHSIIFFEVSGQEINSLFSSGRKPSHAVESMIVQECIEQHKRLNRVSKSINTVRFVTALDKMEKVVELGAYMRFGSSSSLIDNLSKGGLAVKIDIQKGCLSGPGQNIAGKLFPKHPDSGILFNDFAIPCWNQVRSLASAVQKKINYHKIIGMDIAITNSGPVIIEINSIYDNVGLEGICGPLFSRKDVYELFMSYKLIFCKRQISLIEEWHASFEVK